MSLTRGLLPKFLIASICKLLALGHMRFIFSFICVCLCALVHAQVVDISAPAKLPAKTGKFRIVGKNNDGIMVRLYGGDDVLNIYTNDLKLGASKTIMFKNQTGPLQYIMLNKTGSVIFYLSQDKKMSVLYAQPLSSKFAEIGKPIAIDTIYDRKELVANNLRFKSSVDQNFLFIYYPYFSSGQVQSVKYICLDRALNKIYNRSVAIQRSEKELESSQALIDNNGNSFLIVKPEKRSEGEQYDVFTMNATGDAGFYSIFTDKTFFGEPGFEIDNKNGNLIVSGFYDDDTRKGEGEANGFMYASYDPANGTPVNKTYTLLNREFMADLTGRASNDIGKLYTFNVKRILLRNDGGALIIAESFIKDTRETMAAVSMSPGYNNYRTYNVYQFNDIIAFSLNSTGKEEWSSIMRKKQVSEDDNGVFSSFAIMNEKEKLHFVYMDEISTAGTVNDYTLSSDGKSTRKSMFNQEAKDVMLLPKMGKQISPNEMVIPSFKNGSLQLVKITY